MGAWSVKVDGNDAALDYLSVLVKRGFEIAECNPDYLLLADIITKYNYILDDEEFTKLETIIKEEIENVDAWVKDSRQDRLEVLNKLLDDIKKVHV